MCLRITSLRASRFKQGFGGLVIDFDPVAIDQSSSRVRQLATGNVDGLDLLCVLHHKITKSDHFKLLTNEGGNPLNGKQSP